VVLINSRSPLLLSAVPTINRSSWREAPRVALHISQVVFIFIFFIFFVFIQVSVTHEMREVAGFHLDLLPTWGGKVSLL